jgi:hypothetical protein
MVRGCLLLQYKDLAVFSLSLSFGPERADK